MKKVVTFVAAAIVALVSSQANAQCVGCAQGVTPSFNTQSVTYVAPMSTECCAPKRVRCCAPAPKRCCTPAPVVSCNTCETQVSSCCTQRRVRVVRMVRSRRSMSCCTPAPAPCNTCATACNTCAPRMVRVRRGCNTCGTVTSATIVEGESVMQPEPAAAAEAVPPTPTPENDGT